MYIELRNFFRKMGTSWDTAVSMSPIFCLTFRNFVIHSSSSLSSATLRTPPMTSSSKVMKARYQSGSAGHFLLSAINHSPRPNWLIGLTVD